MTIAVIFELWPANGRKQQYLDLAAALRSELIDIDGFISIERFSKSVRPRQATFLIVLARRDGCCTLAERFFAPGNPKKGAQPRPSRTIASGW